ncbi:hypothetical protein ACFQS3_01380 [Glycomyces mayteni]|uniref:Uncharacterized protein n=1 Tax=Glycomyces mayteni TaxID=543887 RepID=A0ABW2D405_9ACTN|nr:hypothetical protein GCM10025732_45380 [Glycomyces mayteni]
MDPIDSQIHRAISRSSATELLLTIAAGTVLLTGLASGAVIGGHALAWMFGASVAVAGVLLGIAAHLGINRARLLLAWQQRAGATGR